MDDPVFSSLDGFSEADRSAALSRYVAIRPFLDGFLPLSQIAQQQEVSLSTAKRWVRRYREKGLPGLIRMERTDKGQRRMSTQLQHAIEGLALKTPRLSIASIYREACVLAGQLKESPPSYSSVHSLVGNLEPALLMLAHEGSSAYKNNYDLVHRVEAEAPNSVWQADHTQLDILIDDRGQLRKPWLTIILDDFSRAVAGYFLSFDAPSAIQTALALRHAICRKSNPAWEVCGIPEILYTDHGCDFTSQHIEQVAASLKMQLVFSTPGQPRGRGKIERFFQSLSQILLPRLPGYQPGGAKNTARPVLTLSKLAAELEAYIVREYHAAPHSATGLAPAARWAGGSFIPVVPDMTTLDLLLLTVAKTRRVQPDGIQFSGFRYTSPTLAGYIGEQVILRYDPRDLAEIRVFHDDRFLCRAICPELGGEAVSLREIVSARKRRQRELRHKIDDRRRTIDYLLDLRGGERSDLRSPDPEPAMTQERKLKRYHNE